MARPETLDDLAPHDLEPVALVRFDKDLIITAAVLQTMSSMAIAIGDCYYDQISNAIVRPLTNEERGVRLVQAQKHWDTMSGRFQDWVREGEIKSSVRYSVELWAKREGYTLPDDGE